LAKFKFHKANLFSSTSSKPISQSYTQTFKKNIKNIVKIKENFLNLLAQKVKEVHKVLNNLKKNKSKLNITTKSPPRKQVIILMSSLNTNKFIAKSNQHIANINIFLKNVKSNILADFIWTDNKEMIITNKIVANSNFRVIENYIKNVDEVDTSKVISLDFLNPNLISRFWISYIILKILTYLSH